MRKKAILLATAMLATVALLNLVGKHVPGIFPIRQENMDMSYIKRIQKLCASPMRELGYNFLANMKGQDNDSIPIVIKDHHEVWPLYHIL